MKRFKKVYAKAMILSSLAFMFNPLSLLNIPFALADTTSGSSGSPTTSIPGMPSPNFDTGDPGFKTDKTVGTWLQTKLELGLGIAFGIATIALIAVGIYKWFNISSSNSKTRGEAIKDIIWWVVGATGTFAAAIICGMLFVFAKS